MKLWSEEDCNMTNRIIAAICAGDVYGAIKLISGAEREELNACDERGYTALHAAVQLKNLRVLDVLLKQPHLNKNPRYSGYLDVTPLFLSLILRISDNLVVKLIESGCDIHVPDVYHRKPLSFAVHRRSMKVARLLIQRGADVNAQDEDGFTPLHEAVAAGNYEVMCMLLCHGASANEQCFFYGQTAFMLAVDKGQEKMQETLLDFVSDFTASDSDGCSILSQALKVQSSLCEAILSQCGDLDDIKDIFTCLDLSLGWKDASIFKHIFTSVSHAALVQKRRSFLRNFIQRCHFDSVEFVQCLYLILDLECAVDFVGDCDVLLPLVQKCVECGVGESERVSLLYLLFAAGMPVSYREFSHVHETFGFGEELEAILLTRPEIREDHRDRWGDTHLMASNIFYGFTDADAKFALWDVLTDPRPLEDECVSNLCKHLQFFTLDVTLKNNHVYGKTWLIEREDLARKLAERNVGSLVELSRDRVRKTIISNKLNTYEIYDAIRSLPMPKSVRDILHLKKPLYL